MKIELSNPAHPEADKPDGSWQLPDIIQRQLHQVRRSILSKLAWRMRREKCLEGQSDEFANVESLMQ